MKIPGAAQVLALRELPDALPGRMQIVELWPFSQGELEQSPDAFIDAAFACGPALSRISPLRKRDYLDRVVCGGYPEAIRRARAAARPPSTPTWRTSSSATSRNWQRSNAGATSAGCWRRWPARSGGLLVPATLATASGIPRTTLNRYLRTALRRLPHQADPRLVNQPGPARHRHSQAGLRRPQHRLAPARPGHRPTRRARRSSGTYDRDIRADGTCPPPAHLVPGASAALPPSIWNPSIWRVTLAPRVRW